jgi:putative endonuclease
MSATATQKQALGAYGERVAARHLEEQGMVVLDRNWRCSEGELDLVLRDGGELVVCEVKTRSTTAYGTPQEAVDATKLERLQRLAERWLAEKALRPPGVRLDCVAVMHTGHGAAAVEHVRGLL